MNGHGPASSTDPRRVLNIANDVPGENNGKVGTAINGAAQKWDGARDTTSHPPDVYTTSYYFQQSNYESADFIVVASASAPVPQIDLQAYPHHIYIPTNMLNSLTAADLAAVIAHEVGHRIGLANTNAESACLNSSSIMNGLDDNYIPINKEVTSDDVFQSNRSADPNTTDSCTQPAPNTASDPSPTPTPDCIDNDGDGYGEGTGCIGPDCDDLDPTLNTSCDSGGGKFCGGDCDQRCLQVQAFCDPWCYCYTPIVIDTAGDGFRLTSGAAGVNFDIDDNLSTLNRLGWTEAGSDDAWLALDRNGNGRIDSGRELFGDRSPQPPSADPNGFLALAEYDKPENGGNSDGVIDSRDAIFSSLRLWADTNHNGVSESGELHTLPEMGVARIELAYRKALRRDRYNNVFRYRAKVYGADGAQLGRWAYDVFLAPPR